MFVIFQENHTFDNYFGTFPGAENLGTALAKAHGYTQLDPIGGQQQTVFKITNPDILSPDQDRYVLEKKFDGGKMDRFIAEDEQHIMAEYHVKPELARQYGLTTMTTYDCDTIPYYWMFAKNFALFDRYFQAETGPSTPGNVSMFAAQVGISQEHRFPNLATTDAEGPGVPINGDLDPFAGPYTANDKVVQMPQSYATLAMTLGGAHAAKLAEHAPGSVANDLAAVATSGASAIAWAWAQEGYVDSRTGPAQTGYVAHHNAPQYFDYIRNNQTYWSHVITTESILDDIRNGRLADRGVFFIKGSKANHAGWKPANQNPRIAAKYVGDDDHPGVGNSDHQIAEAFAAQYVDAIAHSKYWKDSAILITWDDGGGFYDHVSPDDFEECNDGFPCGDGQRVPLIVISPYANAGAIVSDYSDTASVAKFIESTFGIRSMASLPDEAVVAPYGPRDENPALSDLSGAFDLARLEGRALPVASRMAEIDPADLGKFPPPMNCKTLGIEPIPVPTQPPYYDPNLSPKVSQRMDAQRTNND